MSATAPRVGLFATCPVDLLRPAVGFASARLLQQAGCEVTVPPQSCCGQIAWNNGLPGPARELAWSVVRAFHGVDYVVTPSGSCGGMLRRHYPALFEGDPRATQVEDFCARVFELTTFLHDVLGWRPAAPNCDLGGATVTYHDSCAGLRELGIRAQPRALLASCAGVTVAEMADTEVCCGFGGSFCMKFPELAARMADDKLDRADAVTPDYLVGGDLSCLLHLAGRRQRRCEEGDAGGVQIRHVAELLAGDLGTPPLEGPPGGGTASGRDRQS